MKTTHFFASVACLLLLTVAASAALLSDAVDRDTWALTTAYLRYGMMMEAVQQATLMAGTDEALKTEITASMGDWSKQGKGRIKTQLTGVFGEESQERFASFVDEFTTAESENQNALLDRYSRSLDLKEPLPTDYPSFRARVLDTYLSHNLKAASDQLGKIETWVSLKQSDPDTPPLKGWLSGIMHVQQAQAPAPKKRKKPRPMTDMERLQAMESPLGTLQVSETPTENPMLRYANKQQERSDRALEEGRAGMAQVAEERAVAEERYATKQLAAAQADAEAVTRQATQFSAVQREALVQRQNSWSKRLKRIVGSTLSAGIGAFTGGVGARAGQEAANALFN